MEYIFVFIALNEPNVQSIQMWKLSMHQYWTVRERLSIPCDKDKCHILSPVTHFGLRVDPVSLGSPRSRALHTGSREYVLSPSRIVPSVTVNLAPA